MIPFYFLFFFKDFETLKMALETRRENAVAARKKIGRLAQGFSIFFFSF